MQQELDFGETGLTLEAIEALLNEPSAWLKRPRPVRVALTRNRTTMISVSAHGDGPVRVRMHEAFRQAPPDVFLDLRRFIRSRNRAAWRQVGAYARSIGSACSGGTAPAPLRRLAKGRVHDLERIRKEVNREFFSGKVACSIEWGQSRARGRRSGRRTAVNLGTWHAARRLIRIHPLLDDTRAPEAFIRYIVFHEMLHAVAPPVRQGNRMLYHPPQFRALEKRFPDYAAHRAMTRAILAWPDRKAG